MEVAEDALTVGRLCIAGVCLRRSRSGTCNCWPAIAGGGERLPPGRLLAKPGRPGDPHPR